LKKLTIGALALALVLSITISFALSSRAHAANNSEQVVFSGLAQSAQTPVGFWIWCEADSSNSYQGECNGSMHFYALGITKHVEDVLPLAEPSEGQYLMTVGSSDGSVSCTLENDPPASSGPTNTVHISCSAPSLSAVSTNAVVNVTGP
jgi:hypothetical protein